MPGVCLKTFLAFGLLMLDLIFCCTDAAYGEDQAIDPAWGVAKSLWNSDRQKATIAVHSVFYVEGAPVDAYGTAFMLSDRIIITAAHVICDEKPPHKPAAHITFQFNGSSESLEVNPMAAGNAAFECYVNDTDIAIARLNGGLIANYPHLQPGAYEDLAGGGFVTMFGFSAKQIGAFRKGNVVRVDNSYRLVTDMTANEGDSGAPVLDQHGLVVGELIGGTTAKDAVIVPLRVCDSHLRDLSIFLPNPGPAPIHAPPNQSLSFGGRVFVRAGILPNGDWPVPPKRFAKESEAQVVVNYSTSTLGSGRFVTETEEGGGWSAPAPLPVPPDGIKFSAIARATVDTNVLDSVPVYWTDPTSGILTNSNIGLVHDLNLYERSAYVRFEAAFAADEEQIVRNDPTWGDCSSLYGIQPLQGPSCVQSRELQELIITTDQAYYRAFEASAAEAKDISTTTRIASRWANFRLFSRKACSAAQVMQSLFDKFSNAYLTGPLILQTVDMIVGCQTRPSPTDSVMVWQRPGETRQIASVRLIDETFGHFAEEPKVLREQRKKVIADVATALEHYKFGTVTVSEAAAVIVRDETLREFLSKFVSKYVVAWCGGRVTRPGLNAASVQRSLGELERLASTCS